MLKGKSVGTEDVRQPDRLGSCFPPSEELNLGVASPPQGDRLGTADRL